ncbi:AraC family transcriptional regulator [Halioxenophilus sp. WMMB6]|uniref:AraC family transcriptional regulator n=1 Tax=Halioxenophilus sp. WMMB6 TaxID=3073815 RepID=UPI00295EB3F0|nr:AraC family transcriptional regulator [Halioxenophilus sp. WMMB6]
MNSKDLTLLADLIDQYSSGDGLHATAIDGVRCIRFSEMHACLPSLYTPCLCLIVRGCKRVLLGSEAFNYSPGNFLVVSVDLPVIGEITQASAASPYLGLQIELNQKLLTEILLEAPLANIDRGLKTRACFVGHMDAPLAETALRLARLWQTPADIPLLAPLYKRELFYRLLQSPHGDAIAQFVQTGSHAQRIAQAIQILRSRFKEPITVAALAEQIGMSVSSFHSHFKSVTALSPLQYQKRLRLLAAREYMLLERQDAASAAFWVGYESPSQFSREYRRLFGNPPGRDIEQLLAAEPG